MKKKDLGIERFGNVPFRSLLKSFFLICFVFLLTFIFIANSSFAAQIRIAWDPNTEIDLAGYRVFYGTSSGVYGTPINVGNTTNYTLTGLTAGQNYYLSLKAYDTANNESSFSNEVTGVATDPGSVTLNTNPSGLQIVVDGATYTAPQNFSWAVGSSHTVSVASPLAGATGTRYVFSSWSDGGAQTHTLTVPSAGATYTANFVTQYSLTTAVNPANSGTVSPAGTNWYNSGQSLSLSATASAGYTFGTWSGSLSASTTPYTLTLDGAKTLTANFSVMVVPGALSLGPNTGLSSSGTQGGPFASSSQAYTIQNTGGAAINWAASKTQSWVSLSAASGTLAAGASVTVTVSLNSNANSLGAGNYSDTVTFTNATNGGGNATRSVNLAVTVGTYAFQIATNPSGLQVVIDGVTYTAPQTLNWPAGTSHTLSVSSPQGGTTGTRYAFSSWSDGGAQTRTITAPSANRTYTANFTTQYSLTTSASPAAAGNITPSGVAWFNRGQIVSVAVSANSGFLFSGWSGSLTGTANPASVTMDSPKTISSTFNTLANLHPSIGVFRNGAWYFDNNGNGSWDGCQTDSCIASFGGFKTDIPVTGDWTGDGIIKVGIYRNGQWYLDLNGNGIWEDCQTDKCAPSFGGSNGDVPVVGDWTGENVTKLGIYRKGQWYLDKNGNGAWDGCTVDSCLGPFGGFSVDIPVVGNWTGDGIMKIGIYRQGQWYLDKNGNGTWDGCDVDICLGPFGGVKGDIPVIGDWDHTGKDKIGIYRNGHWFLDLTDNGKWDGCGADICVEALGGFREDLPVVANHP